jgi:deazaflavin-dependent oxidoreductase (nitroreductase family)
LTGQRWDGREGHESSLAAAAVVALNWRKQMQKRYELTGSRKAFNSFISLLVGLGIPMRNTFLLTTTGRKSGRPHTTPVTLVVDGGRRWLVSPYGEVGWVHNVRATRRAQLRLGRKTEEVRLTEIPPNEAAPSLKKYLERNPVTAPFFDATAKDPPERFVAEASRHPVFAIDPV